MKLMEERSVRLYNTDRVVDRGSLHNSSSAYVRPIMNTGMKSAWFEQAWRKYMNNGTKLNYHKEPKEKSALQFLYS